MIFVIFESVKMVQKGMVLFFREQGLEIGNVLGVKGFFWLLDRLGWSEIYVIYFRFGCIGIIYVGYYFEFLLGQVGVKFD